jgi:hypothetical protein
LNDIDATDHEHACDADRPWVKVDIQRFGEVALCAVVQGAGGGGGGGGSDTTPTSAHRNPADHPNWILQQGRIMLQ